MKYSGKWKISYKFLKFKRNTMENETERWNRFFKNKEKKIIF